MRRSACGAIAILGAALAGACATPGPPAAPVEIRIDHEGERCPVIVDGQRYVLPADRQSLIAHYERLKRRHQRLVFRFSDPNTPYRCVGEIIYLAQGAGLEIQWPFGAEPPSN
jgi:hypothetical protein